MPAQRIEPAHNKDARHACGPLARKHDARLCCALARSVGRASQGGLSDGTRRPSVDAIPAPPTAATHTHKKEGAMSVVIGDEVLTDFTVIQAPPGMRVWT